MTDVSDRRREPKGIPTGGRFADERSGSADAADLEQEAFERDHGLGSDSDEPEPAPHKPAPEQPEDGTGEKPETEKKPAKAKPETASYDLTPERLRREAAGRPEPKRPAPEQPEDGTGEKPETEKKPAKAKPETASYDLTPERLRREAAEKPKTPERKPEPAPKSEPPAPDPERDRLWEALAARRTDRKTRARLARDPRLLAVAGTDGDARPVAVMGSWGRHLEWLGSDGRMHSSPLSKGMCVDMGGSSYAEYGGYSDRLKALKGHMSGTVRNALGGELRRLRRLRVEAEAGLAEWTAADGEAERGVRGALAAAEERARPKKAELKAGRRNASGGAGRPAPRHSRLVGFMSAAGRAGAMAVGGFLSAVRRLLAPLGRR